MLKGNTRKLGAVGIAAAALGGLLALFGIWSLSALFLALSLAVLTIIGLITHRFVVRRLSGTPDFSTASSQIAALTNQIEGLKTAEQQAQAIATSRGAGKEANGSASELRQFAPIGNFIGAEVYRGGIGPEYEYAERSITSRGKLETFALRTRSIAIRDAFARAATSLHYNATDIQRILRVVRSGQASNASFIKTWNPEQLLALARVLANQLGWSGF